MHMSQEIAIQPREEPKKVLVQISASHARSSKRISRGLM